ncbi:PAS domain S-box protein [Paraglaciecola sp. L3A3]|uniref:PAS domain-containing sensor histidine kinase n=1 Tax=Paraglaciecola sp. L3A3 TaxID=2686358 RepID=UPI00131AF2C7|nr:PAS domain S-box protein [Paraglaciecola sp. L3A3]
MNKKNSQIGRLENYTKCVAGFTLIFVIIFSFYTAELVHRFTVIENSWQQYHSRMANINDEIAKLHAAIGYGGLIHHFKNYVIRQDPQYLEFIETDITALESTLTQLSKYFQFKDELKALKTIKQTIFAYQSKLVELKNAPKNTIKEQDLIAKVDDTDALAAISLLKTRTFELNTQQRESTSFAFSQAIQWLYVGSLLFILILLFPILLLKLIKKLKTAYSDLSSALDDSNLLMLHAPDAMISVTKDGTIVCCNLKIEALFGYTQAELIGKNLSTLLPATVIKSHSQYLHDYFKSPIQRLMGQSNPKLQGLHKDQRLIPIEVNLSSSMLAGIKISTATIRDISARINTENQLKATIATSESNYEKLKQAQVSLGETKMTSLMLDNLPLGTLLYSFEGKILIANDKFITDSNYSRQELSTLTFNQFIDFEKTEDQIVFEKVVTSQTSKANIKLSMLAKLKPKHDQFIPIELDISTYDYNGQVFRIVTYKNLSDVMLIQNRLVKSHEQLARAVAATQDGIWEWNVEQKIANYSPRFMKMIGKEDEPTPEFSDWYNHIHPDYKNKVDEALAQHFKTRELYEIEYLGLNEYGEYNWFVSIGNSIFDEDNNPLIMSGSLRNIHKSKLLEIEAENSKLFLEKIINSAICGLYLFDLKENLNTTINTRYTEILGYDIEELNSISKFDEFYHPDDRPKIEQHLTKITHAVDSEVFSLKYRFKHKDGHWVWCYSFDCVVKFNHENQPELMLGTFVDITEHTLLLEKLQSSNEYLERFAFVASHDLQEPLRKITAFSSSLTQRLQHQISSDEHIRFEFSRLIDASERMRTMIKDLLKLSRINSSEIDLIAVPCSDIIVASLDLLSHLIAEQHAVIETTNTDILLTVDKGLFIQLFQNLIANSIKFKTKGDEPVIHISVVSEADVIRIIFKDNGIGVDPKFSEQIFDPFRRLHSKDSYPGSGIGLALCQQILSIHNGSISCSSEVHKGAEFEIILPKINIKGI